VTRRLEDADYQRLLEFRAGLRRFERWSQQQAAEAGLTPAKHQLLLAVRGHPDDRGPTITDAADYLQSQHHSVVELVDRAERDGLIRRTTDPSDHRVVRLRLNPSGRRSLESLAALHLEELDRLGPQLRRVWEGLGDESSSPRRRA
jgi:DNA-binding MarR family transcriptional regulator